MISFEFVLPEKRLNPDKGSRQYNAVLPCRNRNKLIVLLQ